MNELIRARAAVDKLEQIATRLGELAKTPFDAPAAVRAAEAAHDHMRDGTDRPAHFQAPVDAFVRNEQRKHFQVVEAEGVMLIGEIAGAYDIARAASDAVRPRRDSSTSTAILLSQEHWNAVKPLLDAGRSLHEIVNSTSDIDRLLAVEAFAPDYYQAKQTDPHATPDTIAREFELNRANVRSRVEARLAQIAPADVREGLELGRHADGWRRVAFIWADFLNRVSQGRNDADILGYSIAVTDALQEYGLAATPRQIQAAANAASTADANTPYARKIHAGARYISQ